MPFYDYRCTSCDNEQEEFHSMSEDPDIKCKECGADMKKIMKVGHGGFKLTKDRTRNTDYGTRFGGRKHKSDNTATPSESATAKALAQMEARKQAKKNDPNDPYSEFR